MRRRRTRRMRWRCGAGTGRYGYWSTMRRRRRCSSNGRYRGRICPLWTVVPRSVYSPICCPGCGSRRGYRSTRSGTRRCAGRTGLGRNDITVPWWTQPLPCFATSPVPRANPFCCTRICTATTWYGRSGCLGSRSIPSRWPGSGSSGWPRSSARPSWGTRRARCGTGWTGSPPSWASTGNGRGAGRSGRRSRGPSTGTGSALRTSRWRNGSWAVDRSAEPQRAHGQVGVLDGERDRGRLTEPEACAVGVRGVERVVADGRPCRVLPPGPVGVGDGAKGRGGTEEAGRGRVVPGERAPHGEPGQRLRGAHLVAVRQAGTQRGHQMLVRADQVAPFQRDEAEQPVDGTGAQRVGAGAHHRTGSGEQLGRLVEVAAPPQLLGEPVHRG